MTVTNYVRESKKRFPEVVDRYWEALGRAREMHGRVNAEIFLFC